MYILCFHPVIFTCNIVFSRYGILSLKILREICVDLKILRKIYKNLNISIAC